jgi:mannose/cellobiose epimerase-like protein (N-acyl-D-glucosamine 2-epimerase family)
LSFYYYLTRDDSVLQPMLRIEQYIRQNYFDARQGIYRFKRQGPEADRLVLVAELDEANAYMVLLAPLLPEPYQKQWRAELAQLAQTMRSRFYDRATGFFAGTLSRKPDEKCIFDREDTDFGHSVKAYWMMHFIGRLTSDPGLDSFAREQAPKLLQRAYQPATGSWATQPTCEGKSQGINRTSTWWMAAELDQAALTFGINNPQTLKYIPATFDFWLKHMVDHRYGEVWDELSVPEFVPQKRPKIHLWKNGYHTAEHAMVGYIATSAIRAEPVTLYYAFQACKLPPVLHPYYFDGVVASHTETPLPDAPGFCQAKVTFSNVH